MMRQIKLYLDEDVNPLLAKDLRQRGYDALATSEAGNIGLSDRAQFEFARVQGRAMLTHNRDDFLEIAREFAISQTAHFGILYAPQVPYSQLLQRVLHSLAGATEDVIRNTFLWIP